MMFIHEKIILATLNLADEYQFDPTEIVGELCHAGHVISAFTADGLRTMRKELAARSKLHKREELGLLKEQRDELLSIIKAMQGGEEMSLEFCQRIDRVMEECSK